MSFEINPQVEKYLKSVLLATFVLLVLATAFGAWSYSKINFVDESSSGAFPISSRSKDEMAISQNLQQFKGRAIFVSPDDTFIRVSVDEKTIYSISVNEETKILQEGSPVRLSSINPTSVVSVIALDLPNTAQFDFRAESIEIASTMTRTVEERITELSKDGMNENVDF